MTYAMQIYINQAKFSFPKSTKKYKIQKIFTPFNAPVSNNYFAKLFFSKNLQNIGHRENHLFNLYIILRQHLNQYYYDKSSSCRLRKYR